MMQAVVKNIEMSVVPSVNWNLSTKLPIVVCQVRSIQSSKSNYMFQKVRTTGRTALQIRRLCAATDMTTITKGGDEEDGVQRRKGVFHANLWDDNFLQSLSTDYYGDSYHASVEKLIGEVKQMFYSISIRDGEQLISPYDTTWLERVCIDGSSGPQFSQTIDWILLNQLQDGSWGSQSELSLSHRLVITLACVITLISLKIEPVQIDEGLDFIRRGIEQIQYESLSDEFEIIFAGLLNQAKSLQLSLPYELPCLQSLSKKRGVVLTCVAKPSLYSLEGKQDGIVNTDWDGNMGAASFLSSLASTAFDSVHTADSKCIAYLNNILFKFGNYDQQRSLQRTNNKVKSKTLRCIYPMDLFQRLWMVDSVERLGIDRHFKTEIQVMLDYVYSHWKGNGIGCGRDDLLPDLNATALGLRTLRLHGYNVSSDCLAHFKDHNGQFVCSSIQTVGEIRSVLNLFRASLLAFPGEKVMEEAETFSRKYLKETIQKIPPCSLSREIEYVLEFDWHSTIPRWEARTYIDVHGQDIDTPWSTYE